VSGTEKPELAGLGADRLGAALGEPSSSRFRGDVPTQKGREAVGDGHRNKEGSLCYRKGSVMTHVGCPTCRLRFTSVAAAHLIACPECGQSPQPIAAADIVGFRLFTPEALPHELPEAVAVSIPVPDQGGGQS
jgi:hypothetical protein